MVSVGTDVDYLWFLLQKYLTYCFVANEFSVHVELLIGLLQAVEDE